MPTVETLTSPLEQTLAALNGDRDKVVIALETDMTPQGTFGTECLIVTQDRLRVYTPNGTAPHLRLDLPLSELQAPQIHSLVGGGELQARRNGETIALVRYTNAKQREFSRVNKYLEDVAKHHDKLRKGEEVTDEPQLHEETEERKRCATCNLLLPEGAKVCPACMSKGKVIARLMIYLRPYWKQSLTLSGMILASTALGLISPYLTRPLMDVVLVPRGVPLPTDQRLSWLGLIVLGMTLSQVVGQGINIVQGRVASWLTHQLSHDLRVELYQHLQRLSLRYYDKRQVGSIMTRVTQDSQELESVLTISAQFFLANLLTLIGIGVVLCWLNWRLFLLAMLPAPLVIVLRGSSGRRLAASGRAGGIRAAA